MLWMNSHFCNENLRKGDRDDKPQLEVEAVVK
jgi:hypothetical protein